MMWSMSTSNVKRIVSNANEFEIIMILQYLSSLSRSPELSNGFHDFKQ